MKERMATYRGEIAGECDRVLLEQLAARQEKESDCTCVRGLECVCNRKRPRVLRRFVMRGGELVEVDGRPVMETR